MNLLTYAKKEQFSVESRQEIKKVREKLKNLLTEEDGSAIIKARNKSINKIISEIDKVLKEELTETKFKAICQLIRIHQIQFADLKGVRF